MTEGKNIPSCTTCYYSKGGKYSCDRHVNKLKPDYSKGVECAYNNFAHYRPHNADSGLENVIVRIVDLDGMGGREYEYKCCKCKTNVSSDDKFCKQCGERFDGVYEKDSWGY